MQVTGIRNRDIQLPLFENCDWIDACFSKGAISIRHFREILYEKGWNGKVGVFEAEKVVDLKLLKHALNQKSEKQPVDVLVGYKPGCSFFVYIDLLSSNANRFAGHIMSSVNYSRFLVEIIDDQMNICDTTVVLLGDKYFNLNEHIIRRLNPNEVFSLLPMTVDDFYKRVFVAGYELMWCHH